MLLNGTPLSVEACTRALCCWSSPLSRLLAVGLPLPYLPCVVHACQAFSAFVLLLLRSRIAFGTRPGHCWGLNPATRTLALGRYAVSYQRGRISTWFGHRSMREGPNGCRVLLTETGLPWSWSARQPRVRCCFLRAVPPPKSATLLRPCPRMLARLRSTRRFDESLSLGGTRFSPHARGMW